MNIRTKLFTMTLAALTLSITPIQSFAQDDPKIKKDLGTVIALQGKPCGEVVALRRLSENDYVVTCKSGDRYRVYVDTNDRVIVEDRGKG